MFFNEILSLINVCKQEGTDCLIDRMRVRQWMKTNEIECLELIYIFVLDPLCCNCVRPALTHQEVVNFLISFWSRCLTNHIPSKVNDFCFNVSRYQAGWEIANYLQAMAKQNSKKSIQRIIQMLTTVYLSGDVTLRLCIETAILEHILSIPKIRKAFKQWEKNPILAKAIETSERLITIG